MMKKLTEKQTLVFSFVKNFIDDKGYPPTCREIADAFGNKSANAAHETLMRLQRKGLIRVDTNQARSIVILDQMPGVQETENRLLLPGVPASTEAEQAIAMISNRLKSMSAEKVMAVTRFIEEIK